MFFDDEDERFLYPELFHVVSRELYALSSNGDITPYGFRSVPTHTEDGIPIRKLYVTNLPPKTTRSELFNLFVQYGFIKSCWLRMGEKGPSKTVTPTYAFVTFSNPADAHKALQAPQHEKALRGRHLRIYPADSWHQPAEDAEGRVQWKTGDLARADDVPAAPSSEQAYEAQYAIPETSVNNGESSSEATTIQEGCEEEPSYDMLDVLNRDCLMHVLSYVPIRDIIRTERVSKRWQGMVQEYFSSMRTFKTSWWQHVPVTLTTAVLRRLLCKLGAGLLRLHIDHHWSALNDRTAHTVGKFCPNLEELKVVGMHTKNWNPLIYGCKQLKSLSFVSCNKLSDASLVQLVKDDSLMQSLSVANNTHVTGLFLTGANPPALSALAFYNCYSLQGTVLSAAIETLPNLTTLRLDVCPVSMWKIIPIILKKVPKLEELSLSEYNIVESLSSQGIEEFCEALGTLSALKRLNLSRNVYITNAVLKQVARNCPLLESLDVSSCNSRKMLSHAGVGDEGVSAVCRGCSSLARLDVSYLGALSDAGLAAAARCAALAALAARGSPALSAAPLAACLAACHYLREIDVCGCENVSEEVVCAAERALRLHPRPLALWLGGTGAAAAAPEELPRHPLLRTDLVDDRSNPQLRPDFEDRAFDDSSDESLDDLYDHLEYEGYLREDDDDDDDDDLFLEDELDDEDALYAYAMHAPDIVLL